MIKQTASLEISVRGYGIDTADRGLERLEKQGIRAEKATDGVTSAFERMLGPAASIAALFGVSELATLADTAKTLDARLRLATDSTEEFVVASEALFDIAQRTRAPLESAVDLYAKLAPAFKEAGRSQSQLLGITESVAQAMKLSGSGAAASAAAIQQFAQAMESGVLRGDEFNSINEQGGRLIRALADGMGVARSEMRAMAEAGQLTADVVVGALSSQADTLATEYAQLPLLVSDSLVQMRNEFISQLSDFDEATGISESLAESISSVTDNMELLGQATAVVAAGAIGKLIAGSLEAAAAQFSLAESSRIATIQSMAKAKAEGAAIVVSLNSIKATQAQLIVDRELEVVRLQAQISDKGRQLSLARLADIRRAEAVMTRQQTAAQIALNAARDAGVGKTGAATKGLGRLSRVMGFLGGPAGVFAGVAASAYFMYQSFSDASDATKTLTQETDKLHSSLSNISNTQTAQYIANVTDEIIRREAAIANFRKGLAGKGIEAGGEKQKILLLGLIEKESTRVAELKAHMKTLGVARKKEIETMLMQSESAEAYGKRMYELARQAYPEATETAEEYGERMAKVARQQLGAMETAEQYGQRMYELARVAYPEATESAEEYGNRMADLARQQLAMNEQTIQSFWTKEENLAATYSIAAERAAIAFTDEEERIQALIALEEKFIEDKLRLQQDGLTAAEKFEEASWKAKASIAAGAMNGVSQLLMTGSKKQQEIGKHFGRISITTSTAVGIMKAYEQLGPLWGTTAALGIAASGAAQLINLNTSSMGGGTVSAPLSSGNPSDSAAPSSPAPQSEQPPGGLSVYFMGDVYGMDDFEDRVVDAAKSASGRGVVLIETDDYNAELLRQ